MFLTSLKEQLLSVRRYTFLNNFAILQTGNIIGNIAQAVFGILLARTLQPELFGLYALATGMAGLLSIFLGLGQGAVRTVVSETYALGQKEATQDALAFLVKVTLIGGLVAFVIALCAPLIALHFYHNAHVGFYAFLILLSFIISTILYPLALIGLQVDGRIKEMTVLSLLDQPFKVGCALIGALLGFGVAGAATGFVMASCILFIISAVMWHRLHRGNQFFPPLVWLFSHFKHTQLKRYLGFSFWISFDASIASLFLTLPVLLVGIYVSKSDVTFFKTAMAYINLALSLLVPISILLNVEFPKTKVTDRHKLRSQFVKVSLYSVAFSALLTVGAVIAAPLAFRIVYGRSFLPGLPYISGLLIYGALFGIGVGLGPMWRAINKVKVSILINAITLAIGIPGGLFLIRSFGVWGGVIMVTVWFTCSQFASFFYLLHQLTYYQRE